ncbi:DNA polymerase III, epsilon subunit [Formosa agariphila KMM 3901]|uniref:Excinuclease cho n=1 Tax=Formosa agariphila (strain DSM 15362 / KCTC 12365 / LMG 23005 / KMM 3901 / M-2Alg 35-1) TaxID=1347342 RepID=T2KME5_FORAG|nr:DNA polymerase III, epsilon subunit [Formosa agariphila KMM 3901]
MVNPERDIQPFVVNLTGINSNMLKNAPKFYEIAKRIIEITEDCIIVAHNSEFDYRILRTEFNRLGYDYKRKTLCTVELSKDLIPDQPSYSLGKLVRSLGIPVTDRHRANGDALATVKLFKLLQTKDTTKKIIQSSIKEGQKRNKIDNKLIDIIEPLPTITGVYYIQKKGGDIIYIGKSRNIKRRVNQHFTATDTKSKKIQLHVSAVSYEETGSELVALLKENEEIKRLKPIYNRARKRTHFTHALYAFKDKNGYINLKIDVADGRKHPITTFSNKQSAKHFIEHHVEAYNFCLQLTGLGATNSEKPCFNHSLKTCHGACIKEESAAEYNLRVQELIDKNSYAHKNMIIVDRGRDIDERSAIYIKNGQFEGLGFFNLNFQINNISVLESIITKMENNRDTQHIIQSYLRSHKKIKIIQLPS